MKRLPAADAPVVSASAKTTRLAQAEESSASIPLLGAKGLEEGSDKGQTKAPSTTSDRSGLHGRVVDFR
jgi:hypothetical protein